MGLVGAAVVGLLLLAGLTCTALASIAWRQRVRPGALPLAGLLVAVAIWTLGYGIGLLAHDPTHHRFWVAVQWLGLPFFPLFWLLFSLEYAGFDEYVTRKTAGALAILPLVSMGLAHTNAVHGLLWSEYTINVVAGLAFLTYEFEPWFVVHTVYSYGLVVAGMGLLAHLVISYDSLYADQALSLAVGILVPWIANALVLARMVPFEGLDYTPFAFAITGIAFSNALFRHRLLQFLPGVRLIGREAALEDLESGVLVVGEDRRLVYANPEASTILDGSVEDLLKNPIGELIDVRGIDFDAPDSLGELSREGATYELRCSRITDRHDRAVGHTIVLTDVTERKRRERRLKRQRDELAVIDGLNGVIRAINDFLAESPTREDVEARTCEHLADSGLYGDAWIGRGVITDGGEPTWTTGEAADSAPDGPGPVGSGKREEPPELAALAEDAGSVTELESEDLPDSDRANDRWTSVPIVHGQIVYGLLVVTSDRSDAFGDRELDTLAELGERLGHAIDSVESRALLVGDGYLELELDCTDEGSALVALSGIDDCRGRLAGFVPRRGGEFVAYVRLDREGETKGDDGGMDGEEVVGASDADKSADAPETGETDEGHAAETLEAVRSLPGVVSARAIGDRILEVVLAEGSLATPIVDSGARLRTIDLGNEACRITVEASPGTDVRSLVEAVREWYPDTRLRRKTRRDRLPDDIPLPTALEGLTDRQREALEVAYRAGYFEWPRKSTGEDIATTLGISPPTLHAHLRKAQNALIEDVFDGNIPDNEILDGDNSRGSRDGRTGER